MTLVAPSAGSVISLGAGLALLGNLKLWMGGEAPAGSPAGAAFGAATTAVALRWAQQVGHLAPADLGLIQADTPCAHARAEARATLLGAGVGLGCGLVAAAVSLFGVDRLGLSRHAPEVPASLVALTETELRQRVVFYLPLDTVLPEEVAFRGVLLGALRRRYRAPAAVALAAVPFTFWHTALALQETPSRNVTQLALKFAGYFLAGAGFGALRETTGALSSCLAAHWTLNATLMLLLHPAAQRVAARVFAQPPSRPGTTPGRPRE